MKKTVVILTLLTGFLSCLYAQNSVGIPLIINYNKDVFEGGTRTWDIKQDSKGIMYFANDEGLITFNGNFWRLNTLPNKTILRSVYIDKNDRAYVGGQDEIGYFEPGVNGELLYRSLKKLVPDKYRSFADIWNTTVFGGSVFFRASDRLFKLANNRIEVSLPTREWLFLGGDEKRLFAQDRNMGLLEYKRNQWLPMQNNQLLQGKRVVNVLPTAEGKYVVTTDTDISFLLDNDSLCGITDIVSRYLYTPSVSKINDSLLATATSKDGCLVRTLDNQIVLKISTTEGLQHNNVTTVFVDKDKNIWVGVDNAIACINYSSPIRYMHPDTVNGVIGFSTLIFKNNLYVSSSNGVFVAPLSHITGDLSLVKSRFSLIENTDNGEAWQLDEINQEMLLGHNGGVFIIKDNKAFPLSSGVGAWTFLPTSPVYPAQNIIVGTYLGLNLLRYTQNHFSDAGRLKGLSDSYRFLAMDEAGDLWASHPYRGVYRHQLVLDSMKYSTRLFTSRDGLPTSFNNYVFKIKNRVVFSTESGVYEFNPSTGRFFPSEFLSVFQDISVRYMKEDVEGNIWFCSGRKVGVASFTPAIKSKSPYVIHYLPELEGYISSRFDNIYPYNKENIFIGSEKGLIDVNYEKYVAQKQNPTVLLNQIKVIEKTDSILFGGFFPRSEKGKFLQPTDAIPSLKYSFNSFRIGYGSPLYGRSSKMEYSYKLEGYDKTWSPWTSKTEKDYTNLSDGSYTFEVKSRDNLFNESEVVTYSFKIRPPWYKTAFAIAAYVLVFCCILFLLERWQRKRFLQLRQQFEEKQKQMEYIHQLEREKNEKEIVELQNEKLANEVAKKSKELASTSMRLEGNQTALSKLKDEVIKLNAGPNSKNDITRILAMLKDMENNNENWDKFATHFDEVNDDLLKKLKKKYPVLSQSDLKVCAYLHLNFSSKQISQLSNITVRSVEIHRYRIRKKMGLKTGQSINDFLESI